MVMAEAAAAAAADVAVASMATFITEYPLATRSGPWAPLPDETGMRTSRHRACREAFLPCLPACLPACLPVSHPPSARLGSARLALITAKKFSQLQWDLLRSLRISGATLSYTLSLRATAHRQLSANVASVVIRERYCCVELAIGREKKLHFIITSRLSTSKSR